MDRRAFLLKYIGTLVEEYTITPTLTNVTADSGNPSKIVAGGTATLTFTANSGYALPSSVSVTGATGIWNSSTGVLSLSNPTDNITFSIVAESALPQLSTPTNVSVSGTTATFDSVENATSYDVLVDGVSIGTYSTTYEYTQSGSELTLTNAPYTQTGSDLQID